MHTKRLLAASLLLPILAFGACGGDDSSSTDGGKDVTTSDVTSTDGNGNDVAPQDAGTDGNLSTCTKCTVTPCACDVVTTSSFACSLMSDGTVYCWGQRAGLNADGGLHSAQPEGPKPLAGLPKMKAIASGQGSVCAITTTNEAWCWGYDGSEQLGYDASASGTAELYEPRPLPGASDVAQIALSFATLCIRHSTGSVECMGEANNGQLGMGPNDGGIPPFKQTTLVPMLIRVDGGPDADVMPVTGVTEVAPGYFHACVLMGGNVLCTGNNALYGNLGNTAVANRTLVLEPSYPVIGATGIASLGRASTWHSCMEPTTGPLQCWGKNDLSEVAPIDAGNNVRTPYVWSSLPHMVTASASYANTCAIDDTGSVWCWGRNDGMTSGKSDTSDPTPGKLTLGSKAVAVSIEGVGEPAYACAVLDTGEVDCWGDNSFLKLGRGSIAATPTPGPVKF